jgi:hypothetical protein
MPESNTTINICEEEKNVDVSTKPDKDTINSNIGLSCISIGLLFILIGTAIIIFMFFPINKTTFNYKMMINCHSLNSDEYQCLSVLFYKGDCDKFCVCQNRKYSLLKNYNNQTKCLNPPIITNGRITGFSMLIFGILLLLIGYLVLKKNDIMLFINHILFLNKPSLVINQN